MTRDEVINFLQHKSRQDMSLAELTQALKDEGHVSSRTQRPLGEKGVWLLKNEYKAYRGKQNKRKVRGPYKKQEMISIPVEPVRQEVLAAIVGTRDVVIATLKQYFGELNA